MKRELSFTKNAQNDYTEAYFWYNQIESELANKFSDEIEKLLSRILDNSEQFPIVESETRRAVSKQFPYGIFFLIDENRIVVTAILHHRREPR